MQLGEIIMLCGVKTPKKPLCKGNRMPSDYIIARLMVNKLILQVRQSERQASDRKCMDVGIDL